MDIISNNPTLWNYISKGQQDLLIQGEYLLDKVIKEGKYNFDDYSFLVFPFAKAYEGFLKQLFLDVKFITHLDYISDHFRLGKVLSPHMMARLGEKSVYGKVVKNSGRDLADSLWHTWKIGRNQVFHYFPHNLKSLTLSEAEGIIKVILDTMEKSVEQLKVDTVKTKLEKLSR
jgi:hypothetical protein